MWLCWYIYISWLILLFADSRKLNSISAVFEKRIRASDIIIIYNLNKQYVQTLLTGTKTSRVSASRVDASRVAIVASTCSMMDEGDYTHVERNTFRGNLVRSLKQDTFRGSVYIEASCNKMASSFEQVELYAPEVCTRCLSRDRVRSNWLRNILQSVYIINSFVWPTIKKNIYPST